MRSLLSLSLAFVGLAAAACPSSTPTFNCNRPGATCGADTTCVVDRCAIDSSACASGLAYADNAGDLAGTCVAEGAACGNAHVDPHEGCDGVDLANQTCNALGFAGGALACNSRCALDTSGCDGAATPVLRLPLNDSYIGTLNTAGSRRPTFAWLPSAPITGVTYKLEYSADKAFPANQTTLVDTGSSTSYRPAADLPVSLSVPVGTRYYWRVTACLATTCSTPTTPRWINLGRSDHDLNGDGFADLLVAAPDADDFGTDEGAVYLYAGSAQGLTQTPSVTLPRGFVSFAGDLDANGFSDVVLCDRGLPHGNCAVHLGRASLSPTPDFTLPSLATRADDLDGDGFDDLVGVDNGQLFVVRGGATLPFAKIQLAATDESFDGIGDVNGDGFTDLAGHKAKRFALYLGSSDFFNMPLNSAYLSSEEFLAVRRLGDANGDGYADIAARAPGILSTFLGAASLDGHEWATLSTAGMTIFSQACIAGGGDINGDGFSDLVTGQDGAVGEETNGTAVAFFGSAAGIDANADGSLPGGAAEALGITACSTIGDVDGDGLAETAIGAPGFALLGPAMKPGHVYVIRGAAGLTISSAGLIKLTGKSNDDRFGDVDF